MGARMASNVLNQGEEAKISSTRIAISSIRTAIDVYEIKECSFPNSLDDLTVQTDTSAALLKKDSLNDSWGTPFQYKKLSNFKFEIRSAGPDMQFNTEDDIIGTN